MLAIKQKHRSKPVRIFASIPGKLGSTNLEKD
jgi:hypothetical protein